MQDMLNKFRETLVGRSVENLVAQQRAICRQIVLLMRAFDMYPSLADSIQMDITKLILQKIHKPVVTAIRLQKVKEQQVELYQYLMGKLPIGFAAEPFSYKHNTKHVFMNQIVGRNNNQVLLEFSKQSKLVPPAFMCEPMRKAYEMWHFQERADEKVFVISSDIILSDKMHEKMSQYVCSGLNHFNSALLAGVNNYRQIQGIKLTLQQTGHIKSTIEKIRKQCIHPSPSADEIFEISMIKVQKNFGLGSLLKPIPDMSDDNYYLIKIYINTQRVGKAYFIKEQSKKGVGNRKYDYTFVKYPSKQSPSMKSYQEMHLAYNKTKDQVRPSIIQEQTEIAPGLQEIKAMSYVKKAEPEEIDKNIYGRVPEKTQQHHSIVVLSHKGDEYFKQFLRSFEGDSNSKYYQIYEKMHKSSKRKVLYLTHRKNPDDLRRISETIDIQRKHLVLMKIKPQLTLLKQDLFQNAYRALKHRYENFYRQPLKVVYRRSLANQNEYEFYFCFSSEEKAIFAFTLLESADIRANFANPGKLTGCQSLQKLLSDVPGLFPDI